jgi:hypothetical protein
MEKKAILKGAVVLLITVTMLFSFVSVTANTNFIKNEDIKEKNDVVNLNREILFEDSFETYEDFSIDFPPWTNIDVDGDPTFSHSGHTWPNDTEPKAFIIFNPSQTTPPMTDDAAQPRTGDKYAACFAANNAGYINDDWMITPLIEAANFNEVSLWAKAYSDQYQLDTFEIGVSTTDMDPASFELISPVVQATLEWTEYSYSLDDYDYENIYVGVHCNSIDSWFLMVDDFSVTGSLYPPLEVDAGGPYEAFVGAPIQFQGSATGGLEPYSFYWDFGNGDTSEVQNPEYTYEEVNVYDVTLTVTDSAQNSAEDITSATILDLPCCYEVSIPPGFGLGLKATVTEICDENHAQEPWRFQVTGGLFTIPISSFSGKEDFSAGETKTIKAPLLIGLGNVVISFTISEDCDPVTANAFVLGPFVIVK